MNGILDALQTTAALPALVGLAVKGTLLLAAAGLCVAILHRRSAAVRHGIWLLALTGLLVLPLVATVIPARPVLLPTDWLPAPSETVQQDVPPVSPPPRAEETFVPEEQLAGNEMQASPPAQRAPSPDALAPYKNRIRRMAEKSSGGIPIAPAAWPWRAWILWTWVAGVGLLLARLLGGSLLAWRRIRRARPVEGERWQALLRETVRQIGVRRPVRLLRTTGAAAPMTYGLFHPAVALPDAADDWNEERRRAVLLHELAHVRRRDCLTQALAQLACALHWFNPLAWHAAHRLRIEREHACDDLALTHLAQAPAYAEHLVAIARSLHGRKHRELAGAVAMARPSQLEDRVQRVLDSTLRRSTVGRVSAACSGFATLCLVLLLGAFQLQVGTASERSASHAAPTNEPQTFLEKRDAGSHLDGGKQSTTVSSAARAQRDTLRTEGRTMRWSGVLPEGATLEIKNVNGEIRAEATEGRRAEVVARREGDDWEAIDIALAQREDGGVTLCALFPDEENDPEARACLSGERSQLVGSGEYDAEVTFIVRVPAGVRFVGHTVNGEIQAVGLNSNARVETVNGDIEVSTTGYAAAETVNGDIDVRMGQTDWRSTLDVETTNGDISVTLPSGADTEVEAESLQGDITSDFSLNISIEGWSTAEATGTLGSGGRRLRLETTNGTIRLLSSGSATGMRLNRGQQPNPNRRGQQVERTRWSGVLSKGTVLKIENIDGDIRAVPARGQRAEVFVEGAVYDDSEAVQLAVTEYEGGVRIERSLLRGGEEATLIVRVPAGVRLVAHTKEDDIHAIGLKSNVEAHSTDGDIEVSTTRYAAASTIGGDIDVRMGRTNWQGTLRLEATDGDITAVLPEGMDTKVEAVSLSDGEIASEFPLAMHQNASEGKQATGTLGKGGRRLMLQTTDGDIYLHETGHIASVSNE